MHNSLHIDVGRFRPVSAPTGENRKREPLPAFSVSSEDLSPKREEQVQFKEEPHTPQTTSPSPKTSPLRPKVPELPLRQMMLTKEDLSVRKSRSQDVPRGSKVDTLQLHINPKGKHY